MIPGNWSRRGFLGTSLKALTAGAGLPAWFARELLAQERDDQARSDRRPAPSDAIVMGAIGTGGRGTGIMKAAMKNPAVRMVAACDVDATHLAKAVAAIGPGGSGYRDFRDLLARGDIDAVTIGTPDHWHALIAAAALKAGKDVYCEKPLTLFLEEGKTLVELARRTGRVFQVGSQQRSDARFRLACELVRNGRIGAVKTVEARIGENPQGGPFPIVPVPDGLDWDFWLGPTPEVPYIAERCHNTFRWWTAYSGGKATDWGAHHNDIAQWALGRDDSGPVEVASESDPIPDDPRSFNYPRSFRITYTYADGVRLVCQSGGENGVRFDGEGGWIFVSRSKIEASDPKLIEEPLPAGATRLYVSNNHMNNFLDCVRDRERPICDVEVGHRSVSVCHLGNISIRLGGRRLRWDPSSERFAGDEEANEMLSRPMRGDWRLEA